MPLITISRGIGCGVLIISRLVAEALKVGLFDDEKLQQVAAEMEFLPKGIIGLDKKAPGFFDLIRSNRPHIYLDYMEAIIYEVAKKGEGVIIGHGSQMLLRDFECAFHVHVFAGEETRIKNLVTYRGYDEENARILIRKSDQEQRGFFRFAFHMDWTERSLYDLLINIEKLGFETAAQLIIEAAKSDQMKTCGLSAAEAMEKLSLKKKVEAALLEKDINVAELFLEIPNKGEVEVRGLLSTSRDKTEILKTIRAVRGVSKVYDSISVISSAI